MKGVVFTSFLDFVAERFGDDMVDDIIGASSLPHGGAYTSVGTYPHAELVRLCEALSLHTTIPVATLVREFGEALALAFAAAYPAFFARCESLFDFLASVEGTIHVEVRKLYPDAELPAFRVLTRSAGRLVLLYRSPRRLVALAEGLIHGAARHYGVAVRVAATASPGDADAAELTVEIA